MSLIFVMRDPMKKTCKLDYWSSLWFLTAFQQPLEFDDHVQWNHSAAVYDTLYRNLTLSVVIILCYHRNQPSFGKSGAKVIIINYHCHYRMFFSADKNKVNTRAFKVGVGDVDSSNHAESFLNMCSWWSETMREWEEPFHICGG